MAASTTDPTTEFDAFAADLIASGEFPDKPHVLRAAMEALHRERIDEAAYDEACVRAASHPDASVPVEGDIFDEVLTQLDRESTKS